MVTVIVNRRARRLAAPGRLLDAMSSAPDARVVETRTLADLHAIARELAASSRPDDVVVLAGGDGSYMAGASALFAAFGERRLPRIALAPGGTVSTVLRNWSTSATLRVSRSRYARALLSSVARARATPRPTLMVRGEDGEPRVGFIFGAGLVSRFFEVYEREGASGYGGAARIVSRIFVGSFTSGALARFVLSPVPCSLEVDGARAPFDRVSLVAASVVADLGLHMRLLYRAAEVTDRFHVVATPLGPSELGPQMPRVLAGRPLVGERVDALAGRLSLRFEGAGAWVLDGDLFRGGAVVVTPGPVLDVVTP